MKLHKNDSNLSKILTLIKKDTGFPSAIKSTFKSEYDHGVSYGTSDKQTLSGYLLVNKAKGRIFRKRNQMALLNYVYTDKNHSELTSLLEEILKELHQEGVPVLNAAARDLNILKPYAFRITVAAKTLYFDQSNLVDFSGKMKGKIKVGTWQDLLVQNGAAQLYEVPLHSTEERVTLNRPYWWWNRNEKVFPARKLAVYYGPVGLPEGYLFYRIADHKIVVDEFYANKAEGIEGLLKYLYQLGHQDWHYRLTICSASHLEDLLSKNDLLKVQIKPVMLSRIVNVADVLTALKLPKQERVTIKVTKDSLCPWNVGQWQVGSSFGKYRVRPSKGKADYSGSIAAWAQVFLGNLTVSEALNLGLIHGAKRPAFHLDKGRVTFLDYL